MSTSTTQYEIIRCWIFQNIENSSWKDNADLHIDALDIRYQNDKRDWINAGVNLYIIARSIIDDFDLPFIVKLRFHLKYKKRKGSYPVDSIRILNKEQDMSPPSIYLYHKDYYSSHVVNPGERINNFIGEFVNTHMTYLEVYDTEEKEVARALYLTST